MRIVCMYGLAAILTAGVTMAAVTAQSALLHYYRFDEGSGLATADEVSTNPQDGTLLGGMDATDSWIASGLSNGVTALLFRGVRGDGVFDNEPNFDQDLEPRGPANDAVDFGSDSSFNLTNEGTIMMWYRQDPGPSGSNITDIAVNNIHNANWIIYKAPDPPDPYIFFNQPSQDINLAFEGKAENPDDRIKLRSPDPIPVGEWVHIAASWTTNGGLLGLGQAVLYTNGVGVTTNDAFVGMLSGDGSFYLGGQPVHTGNGRGCYGAVDELKIFDTFMDAAAVQAEMPIVPAAPPGTVAFTPEPVVDAIIMSLVTSEGKSYELQAASDLVLGDWTAVGPTLEGNGEVMKFYEPDGDPSNSYRCEVK